jgi:hypothetical protein
MTPDESGAAPPRRVGASARGRGAASEARALIHFMLSHGDIVGTDHAGRTILQLAVDPWTLDQLCAFDADAADLEDAEGEPEPDEETDGPATVLNFAPPKRAAGSS